MFKKHNPGIVAAFMKVYEHGMQETESEFLDSLNLIVRAVEVDDTYSTNDKLKIYELLSQISNCSPKERPRYAKKIIRVLK